MPYEQSRHNQFLLDFTPLSMYRGDTAAPVMWHRDGVLRWVVQTHGQRSHKLDIISKDTDAIRKARRECKPIRIEVLDMTDGLVYSIPWATFVEFGQTRMTESQVMQTYVPRKWWTATRYMPKAPTQESLF